MKPLPRETHLPDKVLGILQTANSVAARARDRVRAYRTFLEVRGVPEGATFAELPVTDKASYLIPSPYADLLADDHQMSFSILSSSGNSGRAVTASNWASFETVLKRHPAASEAVVVAREDVLGDRRLVACVTQRVSPRRSASCADFWRRGWASSISLAA